jgi:fermentation-respiration switch protein FrsA (DUF1100 family)
MKRKMLGSILTSICILILLGGWLYYQQSAMIFYPMSRLDATPVDWGLEYEDVVLQADDGTRLHGWYIPNVDSGRVLLFFHGNAGNISHRGESVEIFHRLGLNVFIIDYRGYGKSEGTPSEAGLYSDARAAWQYLNEKKEFGKDDIVVFGRSLGGAVATNLAAEFQPGALIVESSFSSAKDMAGELFPLISYLVPMRFQFNSLENIQQVRSPLLVLHSPDDEIIPYHLGKKVFQAGNEPKLFVDMKGDHNSGFLLSQPDYEQSIKKFLLNHLLIKSTESDLSTKNNRQ